MNSVLITALLYAASVFLIFIGIVGPIVDKYREIQANPVLAENEFLQTPIGPVVAVIADWFSGPSWTKSTDVLSRKLLLAGHPNGLVEGKYLYACVVLATITFFLFNFITMYLIGGFSTATIIFPLLIACGVYYLGMGWVDSQIATRKISISREFPYFLDLAVMAMSSGATLPNSIDTYVRENSTEPLAQELALVSSEVAYGKTMLEALVNLDDRITAKGVNNALKAIMQGERMGMSISESLSEQADTIRFSRSQDAEKLAEEMKIRMQGPAMMLLFSVLILVLGPAFVQLSAGGMSGF